ncbi:ashwin isoform X1 [Eubalaena glacialis]|uniref:ashwin isoform X1 n=1 Tax=Eubalaena glacialis TaxID=27606 RepID=UPI002A5A1EC5|nr:ashwin isoform X1 [Eubalaena glacialis]XP_061066771.1 ashwin isoform X1 [Eubalaena glacialis]
MMAGDVGGRSCADSELLLHPELLSQEFLLLTLEQKNITVENDMRVNKDSLTDLYVQHAIPLPQRDLPKNRWGKVMEKKREQHEIKDETKRAHHARPGSLVQCFSNFSVLLSQADLSPAGESCPQSCCLLPSEVAVGGRSSTADGFRKRPLIVFDGSSTSTSIKVKKSENRDNDRLKSRPQAGATSNAFRKLSDSSSGVSPLILSSNLPTNNRMEHSNNDTKQNHDLMHRKSPSGPVKSPPLSPVGTTPVKLKRAAPKEEAEAEAANNLKPPEAKRKIQHVTWP